MDSRRASAFTLVELVVVVAIMATLATAALPPLFSYLEASRDTARSTALARIAGLLDERLLTVGRLPEPDGARTLTWSGTPIWKQGALDDTAALALGLSATPADPLYARAGYSYSITADRHEYELAAVFERGESPYAGYYAAPALVRGTYDRAAVAAVTRSGTTYQSTFVAAPSITLSDLAVTELSSPAFGSGRFVLDGRKNAPASYAAHPLYRSGAVAFAPVALGQYAHSGMLADAQVLALAHSAQNAYSGAAFAGEGIWQAMLSESDPNRLAEIFRDVEGGYVPSRYPGCDTDDIVLANGQRWAACNAGAIMAYVGQPYPSGRAPSAAQQAYLGAFYQWGRNDDVTAGAKTTVKAATGTTADGVGHADFIAASQSPYDWIVVSDGNLWGGLGTTATVGTFAARGSPASMRGPCATGYHVPTAKEWCDAIESIVGSSTCTSS